jgi:hypothetical protein
MCNEFTHKTEKLRGKKQLIHNNYKNMLPIDNKQLIEMVSRISHIFLAYSEQEHIQQYINIMQTCRENGTSWGIGFGLWSR